MARQWIVGAAALLAAGPLVLGGCASAPQASTSLPSSNASSASSTLQPLGPVDLPMPAEARHESVAGADAALRYYLQLVTHQQGKSGQVLRNLSRDCRFCSFLADRFDSDAAAGLTYQGGGITVENMSPPAVVGTSADFTFTADQAAIVVRDKNGSLVPGRGDTAATGLRGAASAAWDSAMQTWLITQLSFEQR